MEPFVCAVICAQRAVSAQMRAFVYYAHSAISPFRSRASCRSRADGALKPSASCIYARGPWAPCIAGRGKPSPDGLSLGRGRTTCIRAPNLPVRLTRAVVYSGITLPNFCPLVNYLRELSLDQRSYALMECAFLSQGDLVEAGTCEACRLGRLVWAQPRYSWLSEENARPGRYGRGREVP